MDSLLGDVAIAQKAFDGAFERPQNAFTFVDGSSKAALGQGHRRTIPDAKLTTQAEFAKSRADGLTMILRMLYVLLGFSRGRQPLRHGQHAGARGLRAHA